MRIVIDTNVLINAALKSGSTPSKTVIVVFEQHELLKSSETEAEFLAIIARPRFRLIAPSALRSLETVVAGATEIAINERIAACRDPEDDKFLELAVNGRADAIVSGDADLLALNPFRGIPIETPAAFLRRVGSG